MWKHEFRWKRQFKKYWDQVWWSMTNKPFHIKPRLFKELWFEIVICFNGELGIFYDLGTSRDNHLHLKVSVPIGSYITKILYDWEFFLLFFLLVKKKCWLVVFSVGWKDPFHSFPHFVSALIISLSTRRSPYPCSLRSSPQSKKDVYGILNLFV